MGCSLVWAASALATVCRCISPLVALLLCAAPLSAQEIRPDSSSLVVLSHNSTDRIFQLYIKRDSVFYRVKDGESTPHSNAIWVIPSSQLSPRDTLCIIMWMLVGTHQMKADTVARYDGRVNIYRRDFQDSKPEARQS